jgi:hypothetical protein
MGWIHLQLWLDGYREIPVVGMFLLNAIGAVALAAALLVAPGRLFRADLVVEADSAAFGWRSAVVNAH